MTDVVRDTPGVAADPKEPRCSAADRGTQGRQDPGPVRGATVIWRWFVGRVNGMWHPLKC